MELYQFFRQALLLSSATTRTRSGGGVICDSPSSWTTVDMLRRWVAFSGSKVDSQTDPNEAASALKETSEHRELRLRKLYEDALRSLQNSHVESAKNSLESVSEDLRKSQTERRTATSQTRHKVGAKRPRYEDSPLWERRLRFAVHRNLAEVYFQLKDYVRALQCYTSALDDDRSDFLVWIRAARAAMQCGRLHVARRAFETALTMRPGHWLCRNAYQAVLNAIGDADEDCDEIFRLPSSDQLISEDVTEMIRQHDKFKKAEREQTDGFVSSDPEVIRLEELSWASLVDALRICLDSRLTGNGKSENFPVGHPVTFQYSHLTSTMQREDSSTSEETSDEVMIVSDIPVPGKSKGTQEDDDMEVVAVNIADENRPGSETLAVPNKGPDVEAEGKGEKGSDSGQSGVCEVVTPASTAEGGAAERRTDTGSKPADTSNVKDSSGEQRPETRRSSRQQLQAEANAQEADRRQTRISSGVRDSAQEDSEMIKAMLKICIEEGKIRDMSRLLDNVVPVPENASDASKPHVLPKEKKRPSAWVKFVDEAQESAAVERCLTSFLDGNSGPAHLLLDVLSNLSELNASQYCPTLALLWSTLREKLQLHMPGAPVTTALIVEAMLVSGKKAGKAKARRFREAARLLSHVRLSSLDEDERSFLRVRISWLWSQLHECQGEMQQAFLSAEETLTTLQPLEQYRGDILPDCLGPDLSGYTFVQLKDVLSRRISSLKMGRDLEKAREELSKMGSGDSEAARRTVSILSSSVHAAVRHLELDVWRGDDLKTEFSNSHELEAWEKRLDAETELEPRLAVFEEACAKSSDVIGELVCFSVRLRMGVHYYAAKLRSEMEGDNEVAPNDTDSSTGRLSDLLVQIRKYVAMLKKLSASGSASLWNCEAGASGWSMLDATGIASLTLVSLTSLVITRIPLLKYSSTSTELGATQKNRRLGFTRCMLAFARCVFIIHRCRRCTHSKGEQGEGIAVGNSEMTRKMLFVTHLCLKSLVGRGCCREEGTSGALIKLYMRFLGNRMQQLATFAQREKSEKDGSSFSPKSPEHQEAQDNHVPSFEPKGARREARNSIGVSESSSDEATSSKEDPNYEWDDVSVLRHELSQCYQCLYRIPELESISSASSVLQSARWLEDGCRVSKHIGLSFVTGEPGGTGVSMDSDACKNVFLFYRKRIFEGVCRRRRDGGRAKRLREVLSRLAENLPEDAPPGVRMLPFSALNKIVTDVVETNESISREAAENVSRLEQEWNRCGHTKSEMESTEEKARCLQLSITFFEAFALHAMTTLSSYDSEYKRHKTAERRKRPKEVADRLFQASTECIIALRIRPWSIGAWILLGRIYVEISDLALDERELNLSSFGLYRPEDLQTLGDGDIVETVFGRAEACFGFAASLLKHSWAQKASTEKLNFTSARILGIGFDGSEDEPWCGFGDDGDLFGSFGLTNSTTSRPVLSNEDHPTKNKGNGDVCRLASVRFGEAAISLLRLRELRYFHTHWTHNTIGSRLPTHPRNRFSDHIIELASGALDQLREGQSLMGFRAQGQEPKGHADAETPEEQKESSPDASPMLEWRERYVGIERLQWYYSLTEAKLMRKAGRPPEEYLPVFQKSLTENTNLRKNQKQPVDIEPLYKLHSSRMKILRITEDDASSTGLLSLLEKYSFQEGPVVVRVDEENGSGKDIGDWIMERKIAIAEDVLSAMQYCGDSKSEAAYSEYYFKSTYCRALILSEFLKDTANALQELNKLFRIDAAAKVLDHGRDGTHRGYFYKIWNYRITDTGVEPALESERKLVRWRGKILGLYAQLLQQTGEWRLLAAIIHRLKRRSSEDLPVDGALLDDLITAYAVTSRTAIISSMEKGILTNVSVFEASFQRTWDIYVESLRLAQGIKRVRVFLNRGDRNETGAKRLVQSGRPRCLVAIHTTLRLEHLRWKSAIDGSSVDIDVMKSLPMEGSMKNVANVTRLAYVETLQLSVGKWTLDEKMMKILRRRIAEYSASEPQIAQKPA